MSRIKPYNSQRNKEMVREEIKKTVLKAVSDAFPDIGSFEVLIEIPKNKEHGDYSTGVALKIAQKTSENPMKTAQLINSKLKTFIDASSFAESTEDKKDSTIRQNLNFLDKVEVIEPGFINFFLSEKFLKQEIFKILKEKRNYGSNKDGAGKKIIIDYSSPNIAKSFGVGHLRSTIIGQAIYNIYRFQGWECIGDNHLGDWGTQFGKLVYWIKEKKLKNKNEVEQGEIIRKLTIKDLEKLYVDFHKEAEKNPELEEKGREWFKKLENQDQEAERIWKFCVDVSIEEFNKIYDILGVKIDNALGESFYSKTLPETTKELKEKKIIKESRGALIVDFDEKMPPVIAIKSDGATTYLIRDLATVKYRIQKWNPDLFVYEVGADQSLYFKQLFETIEKLGWKKRKDFVHIAHGLVRWKHGKFSTRKGDTIHLEEILQEAIDKSFEIIENSETTKSMSLENKKETARKVGVGAVKYNDLSQHYSRDVVFDWEKILNLKGNSGPYLQYTFARCISVLKKGNFGFDDFSINELEKEEENVLRMIVKFPETIKDSGRNFSPNVVCSFLFDLAQHYNLFYNNCQILSEKENQKKFRLLLTAAVAQVLENGLCLLGIEAPEKM